MPRPKNPGAPEPKKRSRTGCWTCKAKKIKCGEEKPRCLNCDKNNEAVCDYSIRLNWEGRSKRKANDLTPEPQDQGSSSHGGQMQMLSFQPPISRPPKARSADAQIDPALVLADMPTSARDFSTQYPRPNMFGDGSRPSSAGSHISSPPGMSSGPPSAGLHHQGQMLPPFALNPQPRSEVTMTAFSGTEHRDKRARPSPTSQPQVGMHSPDYLSPHPYSSANTPTSDIQGPKSKARQSTGQMQAPENSTRVPSLPLTPSNSSVTSEDVFPGALPKQSSPLQYAENDPRRLSVNSLLTQQEAEAKAGGESDIKIQYTDYGIDRGLPDLDIPRNDDVGVIDVVTPVFNHLGFQDGSAETSGEFGFGLYPDSNNEGKPSGYPSPMTVSIPNSLPLPHLLLSNKMNLMYFHFFLTYTARILVPHDCPENPFKIILPQMAVRDDNLLHLLLAYSASHRARLLGHPVPTNRIAQWVTDVFPNLRHALSSPQITISNVHLATAIMLASLEIIAPNTFGVGVRWQDHLSMARSMIIARGGPVAVNRSKDRVSYFLIRWFAYLDVLGNFSSTGTVVASPGATTHRITSTVMFSPDLYDFRNDGDFQIDCVLGFSGYLASVLAKISDLARRCDAERIDARSHEVREGWRPSPEVELEAERIRTDLENTRISGFVSCPHKESGSEEAAEMEATNEAFFWAGLIHLYRRVLGLKQNTSDVQDAVGRVVLTLKKVKKGGSAEACMLFPLFTAGCEAVDRGDRDLVYERISSVESSGMTQVQKARKLMVKVWETGRPWETLVQGEFFG